MAGGPRPGRRQRAHLLQRHALDLGPLLLDLLLAAQPLVGARPAALPGQQRLPLAAGAALLLPLALLPPLALARLPLAGRDGPRRGGGGGGRGGGHRGQLHVVEPAMGVMGVMGGARDVQVGVGLAGRGPAGGQRGPGVGVLLVAAAVGQPGGEEEPTNHEGQ